MQVSYTLLISNSKDAEMEESSVTRPSYKVYKRRFWGLAQLVLLNIVWLTFSSISGTAAEYFNVSESAINWMSTGYLFAFCVASPFVIWVLNKGGPKPAIIITATLLLVGNWLRYAGTKANGGIFGLAMFGQILISLAQPFCLCAPTRYSDLWFSDKGRTSATAVASLANPLGAALGQLIDSEWASKPSDIPNMVLYISIIATVAAIPSFFLPAAPPTPPSASSDIPRTPLIPATRALLGTVEFWLIFVAFSIYVGFFNSVSSLLNQILEPHGFSETEAGIAGAILIVVGLVTAAVISPITDRYKHYLGSIRVLVPIVVVSYIGLIFAPSSSAGIAPSYVIMALIGASSFALLPVVLEYLVEITYPFSPEIGSTICWTGGQLFGACFILIQDALKDGASASPPFNMHRALIFSCVLCAVAAPFPLSLGLFGRVVTRRRLEIDRGLELQEAETTRQESGDGKKKDESGSNFA
ncbi:Major facilitator superfamily domain general substrate transporter [Penicillium angulare]|uniref:Major facilitator superfamily domain general substrate transporter n=1 Tax=Penicillium angulare TaxID=116970 RepID=UPI0025424EF4|nr:Major facilitator superfamily domain general substrate transporter [Penicillium angulare]KAJ5280907.1 Major facilitator superfamily domain general substrate transporter [Penicillium angulare]